MRDCTVEQRTKGTTSVEYYLVRLSYTPTAWRELIDQTTTLDQRLAPIRQLVKHLRGSLAAFHFYDPPYDDPATPPTVVQEKMAMLAEYDLLAILAVPDKAAAQVFNMAISSEPGVKKVDLTSIIPLKDTIAAMPLTKSAVQGTKYRAPGRP
jgi:uncharacterized protein with GYD domain